MRPLRGIAMKLGSVTLFMAMYALIKATSGRVPAGEAVFFRSAFAMPSILVWLLARGDFPTGLRVVSPFGHLLRGVLGAAAMGFYFAGLGFLPLPEITAISYGAPLLTIVFAALFLGERVGWFRSSAVAFGVLGVAIVAVPDLAGLFRAETPRAATGAAIVLTGAVMTALAQTWVRRLVQTEQVSAIVFYFSLSGTLLSLCTLPFGWVLPTPDEAALLIAAGLLGGIGQALLTSSYREAEASLVAPFEYASMVLAIGIGYLVFAEVPTGQTLAGAAIITAAGLIIIWRERQLSLRRARQRAAAPQFG